MTGVLSAANEKAVELFIDEKWSYDHATYEVARPKLQTAEHSELYVFGGPLPSVEPQPLDQRLVNEVYASIINQANHLEVVELTCEKHQEEFVATPSLEEIIYYDLWARDYAASIQQSSGLSPVLA
ncbi:hypothetical protein Gohar_011315 [Gossypium harknessii]|uniref:Uncharacterized protein n=1 Tax=Gossypium harknessii TaxID=34285 RepID=A0A7J9GTJ8_9ROSI|nr:hypothetical protein [Gossypium harknessii]